MKICSAIFVRRFRAQRSGNRKGGRGEEAGTTGALRACEVELAPCIRCSTRRSVRRSTPPRIRPLAPPRFSLPLPRSHTHPPHPLSAMLSRLQSRAVVAPFMAARTAMMSSSVVRAPAAHQQNAARAQIAARVPVRSFTSQSTSTAHPSRIRGATCEAADGCLLIFCLLVRVSQARRFVCRIRRPRPLPPPPPRTQTARPGHQRKAFA